MPWRDGSGYTVTPVTGLSRVRAREQNRCNFCNFVTGLLSDWKD